MQFFVKFLSIIAFFIGVMIGFYILGWLIGSVVMWEIIPFLPELDLEWVRGGAIAIVFLSLLTALEDR